MFNQAEMQTIQHISIAQLREIICAIFDQGDVVVKQAYSDFDCPTRQFGDVEALIQDLSYQPGQKVASFSYVIYYPEAKGHTHEKRINLKPESCMGHTFRFTQEGWGLIQLQCNFRDYPKIECRIAVNSRVRAGNWFGTYPDYENPDMWDWEVVKKKAGRLVRLLRNTQKQAGQNVQASTVRSLPAI